MGKVVLGVTVSMDGFAQDANGSVGSLYPDPEILHGAELLRESIRDIGFRPFQHLDDVAFRLERIKTVELPGGRTHLRFRVLG